MPSQFSLGNQIEHPLQSRGHVLGLCGLVMLTIFISDLFMPLGVAEAIPYVAAVLLALRSPEPRDPLIVAAACSVLTLIGYFLSHDGTEIWIAIVNRSLAIFAIWATAILAMQVKQSDSAMRSQSQMLTGILTHMPAVAFKVDDEGYMRESVGKGLQRIGLKEYASVGRNLLEPPPDVRDRLEKGQSAESIFYESHGIHQGSPWWFLNCVGPDTVEGKGSIGFGIDITDRKKVERRLATHDAVAQVLANSSKLSEATPSILEAICQSLGWELGALWNIDPQKNVLRCTEVWHLPSSQVDSFVSQSRETTFAPGIGLPGRVWESGKAAWIHDVTQDKNFPRAQVAVKNGLHAAFGFPICLDHSVFGVMEFFSKQIEEPDETLLHMFASLGSQIGQLIEREHKDRLLAAHSAVTCILSESTSLSQATPQILKVICQSLDWVLGAIWNVDDAEPVLRCVEIWHAPATQLEEFEKVSRQTTFARGIGLPGRVWETGEPSWIPDAVNDPNFPRAPIAAKEGLHAAFGFPIKIGHEVLGMMEFFHRETQEPDKELLQMFGSIGIQIGQFIQRTRNQSG